MNFFRPRSWAIPVLITIPVLIINMAVAGCGAAGVESPPSHVASPSSTEAQLVSSAHRSTVVATTSTVPADPCVRKAAALPLRTMLAQLLVVGVTGADDAAGIISREKVGGIFIGSWTDLAILNSGRIAQLQHESKIPVMVTVDQEGGRVARLKSLGINLPSARELAHTKTPAQVRVLAREMGKQMKQLGISVDFAPAADVSDEPADAVIGDRSFGNDPELVTQYVAAYAAGLRDAGIMPVFKHFPGHGHGSGDSHTGEVTTPGFPELQRSDLVPYRTVLQRNDGVMVGHLGVPGLTELNTPASLSPAVMELLRGGVGYGGKPFDGVIFTDDLSGMAAISNTHSISDAVLAALKAGADAGLWLSTTAVSTVLDYLVQAVRTKKYPRVQAQASAARMLRVKAACS